MRLRHTVTGIKVDLAVGLTGFERQLIARAEMMDLHGVVLPVARAEDLGEAIGQDLLRPLLGLRERGGPSPSSPGAS